MAQVHEPRQDLSFNDVRAALMELRESQKETDWMFRESREEIADQMKETDRKISRLGSRIGDLIEHLAASNILEEFKKQRYEFTRISRNNKIEDEKNRTLGDVKDHIKRMETLRRYADLHHDGRKYVSSVSGALIEDEARNFALQSGIYVIEHPGERIRICPPETVRTW
jgi:Mg2+ and Co2+ transporter CorA